MCLHKQRFTLLCSKIHKRFCTHPQPKGCVFRHRHIDIIIDWQRYRTSLSPEARESYQDFAVAGGYDPKQVKKIIGIDKDKVNHILNSILEDVAQASTEQYKIQSIARHLTGDEIVDLKAKII